MNADMRRMSRSTVDAGAPAKERFHRRRCGRGAGPSTLATAVIAAATLVAGGCSRDAGTETDAAQAPGRGYAFVNVNVVPVRDDGILRDRMVVVRRGRVESIVPSGERPLPPGLTVIDAAGGYLLPGLADMHAHPMTGDDLLLYLANGVTLIRAMWGEPSLLALREQVERGRIPGPRIYTAGRIVDGRPPIHFGTVALTDPADAGEVLRRQISAGFDFVKIYSRLSPEAFDALAAAAAAADVEFSGHVPAAVALDHALDSGMRTMEHLYGYLSFAQSDWVPVDLYRSFADPEAVAFVAALGRGEFDARELLDRDRLALIAGKTASSPAWIVPTLSVLRSIAGASRGPSGAERYLSPGTRYMWSVAAEMRESAYGPDYFAGQAALYRDKLAVVKALRDAGARILAGTDAPNPGVMPGFAVVEELRLLTEAGLSNAEAIRAATYAPALYMNEADERGHIAEGVVADLVLVAADPLEDLAHVGEILGVMRAGDWPAEPRDSEAGKARPGDSRMRAHWFDAAELESMLRAVAERSAAVEARLEAAPLPEGPPAGRADFLGADGGQLSLTVSRSEGAVRVDAALKLDDDWERFVITRDDAGFALTSGGTEYRLAETEGRRELLLDGEPVAEAAADGVPALLSTGTHADLAVVHELTRELDVGERMPLQIWRCEGPTRCGRPAVETWRVTRRADAVVDGHFYYTGTRVLELSSGGEERGTMWIGGGFYDGQPIRMSLDAATAVSRLTRVR